MEKEAAPEPSNYEDDRKGEHSAMSDCHTPPEIYFGCDLLPGNLLQVVADYILDDNRDPTSCAILGEKRITLCLSQVANLELGSCWHLGCLSPEDRWVTSMTAKVDKYYDIMDYQSILDVFSLENSPFYRIAVDTLVFQLDISSQDFSSDWDNFQNTLTMLQPHLKSVRHVIIAMEKHAFCCFFLKDVIDNATGVPQKIDRAVALQQIVNDLRICRTTNQGLSTKLLLEYYMLKDTKPESDKYLSKFVISLNNRENEDLFDAVDPILKSSKLMWIQHFETLDDLKNDNFKATRHCHVFYLDDNQYGEEYHLVKNLQRAYSLEDNHLVERIMVTANEWDCYIALPRPRAPLTDCTAYSALIELTLNGQRITLDLTQLNNGFFPHLEDLSVIGGHITGQLDSCCVRRLKKLIIETESQVGQSLSSGKPLIRENTQRLINTGFPWQIVATDDLGGWSLASFEKRTPNPQYEEKEDSLHFPSHSLPIIRELMLVIDTPQHANVYQLQLEGKRFVEVVDNDHKNRRLVWAPECVQKITAFCISSNSPYFKFNEEIPGKTRILISLTCHKVDMVLHGDALPHLRSLEVNGARVNLSGAFPSLQTLSFSYAILQTPWELNAPMLQTFHCHKLMNSMGLTLRLQSLPHLSSLCFPSNVDLVLFSTIRDDGEGPGLPRIKHIVFGRGMPHNYLDRYQVNRVLHLELAVHALLLPECWSNTEWHCETLKITFYAHNIHLDSAPQNPVTNLPQLLPRLKTLTVTEENCLALLDSEMPELTDCTVPSSRSLGPKLKCPALRCIRFTAKLSESDKEKCLDRARYEAIGAQPEWVYFGDSEEVHRMSWDVAPSATGVSSFAGPLEEID